LASNGWTILHPLPCSWKLWRQWNDTKNSNNLNFHVNTEDSYYWLTDYVRWDWCLRTAAITGLLFIPQVMWMWELQWWWCWLGTTPDLSTRALWQSYQQTNLERVGGMGEGIRILHIQYLWYVSGSFTCYKMLWHGTSGIISHPKEGVLQIFIALKDPSPQPGLNPQPLGPVASTLTTTPPMRLQTANWVAVWHSFPFIPTFGSLCNTFSVSTCSSWINFNNNNHNTKKTLNSHTWIIWIKTAV
jgi:hypothetical protein